MNRDRRWRWKWILGSIVLFFFFMIPFTTWILVDVELASTDDDQLSPWSGDTYRCFLYDIGPGTIMVDVLKVMYEWESKENIRATLLSRNGEIIAEEFGTFHNHLAGRGDGSSSDYFDLCFISQVNEKADYQVVVHGLRKDSRDKVEIFYNNIYDLGKDELMLPNGTCRWHFEGERPKRIYIQATKTFPDGAVRNNIEARLLNRNDTCIEYCHGIFINNDQPPEDEAEMEYEDDNYPDTGWGWWWFVLIDPPPDPTYDHYYLSHEFETCGVSDLTLEVAGLRPGSKDEISVIVVGDQDGIGHITDGGKRDHIDRAISAISSSVFITILGFFILAMVLVGLCRLFVKSRNI